MVARTQKKFELPKPLDIQPEELAVLNPPDRMSMSSWAESHYVLTGKTAAIPGPWRNANAPYLVEPMDMLSGSAPVKVTISACTQAGKSEVGNIFLGWSVDQCPAPFMFLMPTKPKVATRVNTRLRSMFEGNESLLNHLGDIRNLNIGSETAMDNMILFLAWAHSEVAMSDVAVAHGVGDEVGKWPTTDVESKADPMSNFDSRFRTFKNVMRKLIVSSPGVIGDMFDVDHKEGDDRKYWVKCWYCDKSHVQRFENVELDKTDGGKLLTAKQYKNGGHARYKCPHCQKVWSDRVRWTAIIGGKWLPCGVTIDENGKICGTIEPTQHYSYSITCFMLNPKFFSLDLLAAQWAKAQKQKHAGNKQPLRAFLNDQLAQSWQEMGKKVDIEIMKRKGNDIGRGIVPVGCKILMGGMDYHETDEGTIRLDFLKLGIADGPRGYIVDAGSETGHKSRRDELERNVEARMFDDFSPWSQDCGLPQLAVTRAFIDSGFKTYEVYDWCHRVNKVCPGLMQPTKGHDHQRAPLQPSAVDKIMENANRRRRTQKVKQYRGLMLYHLDTTFFKDLIIGWAENPVEGPGYLEFACDLPDWFLREFCAEHRVMVRSGSSTNYSWVPTGTTPSHGIDIAVGAMGAGYSCGMLKMRIAGDIKPAAAKGIVIKQGRRIGKIEHFNNR